MEREGGFGLWMGWRGGDGMGMGGGKRTKGRWGEARMMYRLTRTCDEQEIPSNTSILIRRR